MLKKRLWIGFILLITGRLFWHSCNALFGSAKPEQPIEADRKLSPEEVAEKARAVSVLIECRWTEEDVTVDDTGGGSGTGVIVEAEGDELTILTNLHVLGLEEIAKADLGGADPPELKNYVLRVTFSNGQSVGVRRLLVNPQLKDFALLSVNRAGWAGQLLPLAKSGPPQGAKVFAMGMPFGQRFTFTQGVVSAYRWDVSPRKVRYEVLQTDTAINAGNSGGPLLDEHARIVGLNTFKLVGGEGLNFAITSQEILRSGQQDGWTELPLGARQLGLAAFNLFSPGTGR